MTTAYIDVGGIGVEAGALTVERARAVASLLGRGGLDYARLVECRRRDGGQAEVIVVDLDVQRPQKRTYAVRATERVGMTFFADDRRPEVISLRGDFPQVPHLNLSTTEYPKELCLYEQDWTELKARWTPVRFVERVRLWFAETVRGSLHQADQPLEPLIVGSGYQIVVPHDLFTLAGDDAADVKPLVVRFGGEGEESRLLLATRPTGRDQVGAPFVAVVVRAEPQTHGVIRNSPSTLNELHRFLSAAGCDLLGKLRASTSLWGTEAALQSRLLVVAICPKRRGDAAVAEAADVWTFLTLKTVDDVLVDIGRRGKAGGYILGVADEQELGHATPLDVLRTAFSYSLDAAAYLNGRDDVAQPKVVAVGLGALGSKLQLSLARSGFGQWTLVDDDLLLPHNLARHQYTGVWVGHRKANVARKLTLSLFPDCPPPEAIVANVLRPEGEGAKLAKALVEADLILDMSASVTVARHLAAAESNGRRVSVFFNPAGTELVLLAEDASRTVSLDALEFQLYRGLLNQPELESHLFSGTRRVRYAASCRDITSRVPDDQVSLLAAIGARAVRTAVADSAAQIRVWKLDLATFGVMPVSVPVTDVSREELGGWTVIVDGALQHKLQELRQKRLPNETGGVLLGFFDHEAHRVYVVDTIPSPPDSEEWPTIYIRGSEMLGEELKRVDRVTAGNVEYVGEWHSHPESYSCRPSTDDVKVFGWLTEHMADEGQPALMAIVGDRGPVFFLGEIVWRGE